MDNSNTTRNTFLIIASCVGAAFFATAFILWTLIPHLQTRAYFKHAAAGNIQKILNSNFIFSPHTYAQSLILHNMLASLVKQNVNAGQIAVLDIVISKLEKLLKTEGANQQQYILMAKAYDKKAKVLKDPEIYKIAEEYYKKAMNYGPKRQEPNYAFALSLVKQNRTEEAVKLLRETLALEERLPLSHFYLGIVLSASKEERYVEAFDHLEFFAGSGMRNPDSEASLVAYQNLLSYFSKTKDKDKLLQSAIRLAELDSDQKEIYLKIADYIKRTGKVPNLNIEVE